jgi:hypothetical protein
MFFRLRKYWGPRISNFIRKSLLAFDYQADIFALPGSAFRFWLGVSVCYDPAAGVMAAPVGAMPRLADLVGKCGWLLRSPLGTVGFVDIGAILYVFDAHLRLIRDLNLTFHFSDACRFPCARFGGLD